MFWALLAAFFLSGGTASSAGILTEDMISHTIDQLETVVIDADRAKQSEASLLAIKSDIVSFNTKLTASSKDMGKLYLDHEAGEKSMLANLNALDVEWSTSQKKIVEQYSELKKSMTAAEWAILFAKK